jgi:hypothetical protein
VTVLSLFSSTGVPHHLRLAQFRSPFHTLRLVLVRAISSSRSCGSHEPINMTRGRASSSIAIPCCIRTFPSTIPCGCNWGHVRWRLDFAKWVGITFPGTQRITLSALALIPGTNGRASRHFSGSIWLPDPYDFRIVFERSIAIGREGCREQR